MSFYEARPEEVLRFGDVLSGYVLSASHVDEPNHAGALRDFRINVNQPGFAVVLTPCCSIGDKTLTLSPLIPMQPAFLLNPHFAEELTNINRTVLAQQAVSPQTWQKLGHAERERRLSSKRSYALVEYFVYAPDDHLPNYELKTNDGCRQMGYYMVDFRRIHRIECDKIANPKQAPLDTKVLQLSIETRDELRKKLSAYFSRVPKEDAF